MAQRYGGTTESQDTGERGHLEADAEWDGSRRPRIRIVEPFWESESERLNYLFAVEETRGMLPGERMEAIRRRFSSGAVAKPMPPARQTRRERDEKLQELREQAREEPEPWWQK